jgi:hypothetical protein
MSLLSRRQAFKVFLNNVLQTAGSVVLATAVLPGRVAAAASPGPEAAKDLRERADQLANARAAGPGGQPLGASADAELGGAFRNAFANGGFHNGGFTNGSFHNGGFANGAGGGGFHNGGFVNGGFRN